jgi:hypothetical protein
MGGRTRAQYFAQRRKERQAQPGRQVDYEHQDVIETLMLTRLGKRILDAAREREGKSKGGIVEEALRQYAAARH